MPRKRKSGLRNTYNSLRGPNAEQYKANTLAFFQSTSTMTVDIKNTKRLAGMTKGKVGIIPFYQLPGSVTGSSGTAALAAYMVNVNMTQQALQIGQLVPALDSKSFWERAGIEFDPQYIGDRTIAGFYPALARVSVTGKTSTGTDYIDVSQRSHITGRTYKLAKRRSGSIPFGRGTKVSQTVAASADEQQVALIAEADYGEVQGSINEAIANYNKSSTTLLMSATFEPEVVRETVRVSDKYLDPAQAGTFSLT